MMPVLGVSRSMVAAIFAALVFFYGLTLPGNTVEAIDGYDYALAAETIPLTNSHDTRSILFHKINRVVYLAAANVAPGVRAYTVLRWLSVLAAAGAIILFARLMVVGFGLAPVAGWTGAALLGASYGFWRYALEVEVYAPSTFLILTTLNLIVDAETRHPRGHFALIPAGIFGGLTALYYQPNTIPLFLAAPVLLLSRRTFWRFTAYGAAGSVVVLAGLCIAYAFRETAPLSIHTLLDFINDRGDEFPAPGVALWSFGQAGLSVAHDFISNHWLYGFDGVTRWVKLNVPKRYYRFEETIYAAQHALRLVALAPVVLAAFCAAITAVCFAAWRGRADVKQPRLFLFMIAWFVIHTLIGVKLDPSTEEAWVIAVTPLIALFTVAVFEPACRAGGQGYAFAAVTMLLMLNYTGGIGIYRDGANERRRIAMAYIEANARPGDAFVSTSSEHYDWLHARYRLGLSVIYVKGDAAQTWGIDPHANIKAPAEQMFRSIADRGGRIFALERVFTPGDRLRIREDDEAVKNAKIFAARWQARTTVLASGPFGRTYQIVP
jgi:hypothetical protein